MHVARSCNQKPNRPSIIAYWIITDTANVDNMYEHFVTCTHCDSLKVGGHKRTYCISVVINKKQRSYRNDSHIMKISFLYLLFSISWMVGVLIFISLYDHYKACSCEAYVNWKSKLIFRNMPNRSSLPYDFRLPRRKVFLDLQRG